MVDKMTTLQESAIRNAIKLLEELRGISYLKYEHTAIENSAKELRAALAQQVEPVAEPTDDQLVKGVKAMRLFVTKNSVADFRLGYMAALAAAPAPQAQDGTFINEGTKSAPKPGDVTARMRELERAT